MIDLRIYTGVRFDHLKAGNISLDHLLSLVELLKQCYAVGDDMLIERWGILDVLRSAERLDNLKFAHWLGELKTNMMESCPNRFGDASEAEIDRLISTLRRQFEPEPKTSFTQWVDTIQTYLQRSDEFGRINTEDLRNIITATLNASHAPPLEWMEIATHYDFANPNHSHSFYPHIVVGGNCLLVYGVLSPVVG
jgi:hypothetical protein